MKAKKVNDFDNKHSKLNSKKKEENYYDSKYPSNNKINAEEKRIGRLILSSKKWENVINLSYENDIYSKIIPELRKDETIIFMRIISYMTFFHYDILSFESSTIILEKWY